MPKQSGISLNVGKKHEHVSMQAEKDTFRRKKRNIVEIKSFKSFNPFNFM